MELHQDLYEQTSTSPDIHPVLNSFPHRITIYFDRILPI